MLNLYQRKKLESEGDPLDLTKYTRHAKNRMRWRKIAKEDIELTIKKPEWKEAKEGKVNTWRKVGPKFLRVTYKEEKDSIVVISAVLKKKRPGGKR